MGLLQELVASYGSQTALADAVGVCERTLRYWGSGKIVPSVNDCRTLNRLAENRGLWPPYSRQ